MVAAAHAGWRGTVNYIAGHTLDRMRALYGTDGKDVIACIGPGISSPSFEVGEEVYEAFRMNGFAMDYISEWKPETHKHHIDLWAANRIQLLDFGVPGEQIETSGICTYMRHEEFFSARQMCIRDRFQYITGLFDDWNKWVKEGKSKIIKTEEGYYDIEPTTQKRNNQ